MLLSDGPVEQVQPMLHAESYETVHQWFAIPEAGSGTQHPWGFFPYSVIPEFNTYKIMHTAAALRSDLPAGMPTRMNGCKTVYALLAVSLGEKCFFFTLDGKSDGCA
jgi:hypothetical protein